MTIITISSGFCSSGGEVAGKVARRLGYRGLSEEVISEASQKFRIARDKLDHAIYNAPSIFERFFSEKQKYIAYVAAETLAQFRNDNVVYDGPAGHFFTSIVSPMTAKILAYFKKDNVVYDGFAEHYYAGTISHLLNVRVAANLEDRILLLMEKTDLSPEQARKVLKKEDQGRNAWGRHFYGVDETDNGLYDLVVHVDKLTLDDAVDIICNTAAKPQFRTTPQSQQVIEDRALAAEIKAALYDDYPACEVVAEGKSVEIYARFTVHSDTAISGKITEKVSKIPGVASVTVILIPGVLFT